MDYNNDQNRGVAPGNTQQDWPQQDISQKVVVVNELARKKDSMITLSLVLGIFGILFFWIAFVSVAISLTGLILGIVSIVKTDQHRGISTAGIITSGFGLLFGSVWTVIYILI